MGLKQYLLPWFGVDLGVMAVKGYYTFPKLQDWSLTIRYSVVLFPGHSLPKGVLSLSRGSVGIFYSPSDSLVYLFNGISTPYGLFNAEISFICKYLIIYITICCSC